MKTLALAALLGMAVAASPSWSASMQEQIKARKRISDSIAIAKAPGLASAASDTSAKPTTPANDPSPNAGTISPPAPAFPASDTSDIRQLPPRTLPFRQQMMFAGGFMVFVALMLTSMQNLNPND